MTLPPSLPADCARAMDQLLADPLAPGPAAEQHLRSCRACAEARVAFLAQDEVPSVQVPGDYFERLPDRILRKLPARPTLLQRLRPFTWAAAALLLVGVGAGGFLAGRAQRPQPAEVAQPAATLELQDLPVDVPFHDHEDAMAQLAALSDADADAVVRILAAQQTAPRVAP